MRVGGQNYCELLRMGPTGASNWPEIRLPAAWKRELIPAVHAMVDCSGVLNAQLAWHKPAVSTALRGVNSEA